MYVMRVDILDTDSRDAIYGGTHSANLFGAILPADRCTWTIGTDTDNGVVGYNVGNLSYNTGSSVVQVTANGSTGFQLGYIGKNGRFVPISG